MGTPNGYQYAACVAAGLTSNEIDTCINTPSKCFGPNNEIRKFLCGVGIGCPEEEYVDDLKWVMPYKGGCIAVFKSGTYFSPDCENLRGGGQTQRAWDVPEPHAYKIRGMVVFNNCVYTAFNGGGIYRSCNGYNLGGGGNTEKLYQGAKVISMSVKNHGLRTVFEGAGCYFDPSGDHPAGGPDVSKC